MDTTELIKKIDAAMENLPEEIRSFLFDGEFDAVFDVYKKNFSDEETFIGLKNKTLEFVLGVIPMTDLKLTIEHSTANKELVTTLKKEIQEKIINELLLILEVHAEMNKEIPQQEQSTVSSTILSRLQESFTKPTSLAPTTRDHSALPASAPTPSTPRAIDPYRELPDEK
jgi:hypothetical protein